LSICIWMLAFGPAEDGKRVLKVQATYTGQGEVNERHQIYVSVFDTSYIGHEGIVPLATQSVPTNSGVAAFTNLNTSPVYIAVFYDRSGTYDPASATAPSGAPAALYGEQPGIADPVTIEAGQTVAIKISFDDSIIMP